MPDASINGIRLHFEAYGHGVPLVFVHEFAGDSDSWDPQVHFFARRYQVITYNARGYPPSDVPEDPTAYSQVAAVEDLYGLIRHLRLPAVHLCGLSMGGYAVLHFGLRHPDLARSLVVAGCGYGCDAPAEWRRETEALAQRIEREGMPAVGPQYAAGPTRTQFKHKDPRGWDAFAVALSRHSTRGSALTLRGVQAQRPTVYALREALERLAVPTLIVTGDEDDMCLEPGVFLKRHIPAAGLLVVPKTGHTINLEEPELFNRAVLEFLTMVDAGRWAARDPTTVTGASLLPREGR